MQNTWKRHCKVEGTACSAGERLLEDRAFSDFGRRISFGLPVLRSPSSVAALRRLNPSSVPQLRRVDSTAEGGRDSESGFQGCLASSRVRRSNFSAALILIHAVGHRIPPHPDPLPRGEGIAFGRLGILTRSRTTSSVADGLPLPRGEGRGEGERVFQINSYALMLRCHRHA